MKKLIALLSVVLVISWISVAMAKEKTDSRFLGEWVRQATYVNNELVGQDPATMTLKKDSFRSANAQYFTEGTLSVSGSSMTMVMTKTNAPGVATPYTVTYTYSISEDGKSMTFIVGPMREVYKRKGAK